MTGSLPSGQALVPDEALAADADARTRGRVLMLNAGRPGGIDGGWTISVEQWDALRTAILHAVDALAGPDGTTLLKDVTAIVQASLGVDPLFPGGRLTNYVRYTKVDLEARGQLQRVAGSSPQRVRRPATDHGP